MQPRFTFKLRSVAQEDLKSVGFNEFFPDMFDGTKQGVVLRMQ